MTDRELAGCARLTASEQITLLACYVMAEMPELIQGDEQVCDTLLRVLPDLLSRTPSSEGDGRDG